MVIASIREPSDFAGLPIVDHGDGSRSPSVVFAPPSWATALADAGRGLAFFDEISTAPPAVQAAMLRVVLERTVGDLTLPDDVSIVAAANPPDQAADGWDLSPPLANRFCHLDWPVDARTVAAGFAGGWPTPAPPSLRDDWQSRIGVTRSWVAGFLTVRPMLALAVPDDSTGAGRAWPSPRSWDLAARLQAAAAGGAVSEIATSLLVRGCVGPGPGVEYLTWLAEADLPDPEAVLADPDSFALPERGDRAYAALTSVAAAVAADADRRSLGARLARVRPGGRRRSGRGRRGRADARPLPTGRRRGARRGQAVRAAAARRGPAVSALPADWEPDRPARCRAPARVVAVRGRPGEDGGGAAVGERRRCRTWRRRCSPPA